jgi:hypothetical protein
MDVYSRVPDIELAEISKCKLYSYAPEWHGNWMQNSGEIVETTLRRGGIQRLDR